MADCVGMRTTYISNAETGIVYGWMLLSMVSRYFYVKETGGGGGGEMKLRAEPSYVHRTYRYIIANLARPMFRRRGDVPHAGGVYFVFQRVSEIPTEAQKQEMGAPHMKRFGNASQTPESDPRGPENQKSIIHVDGNMTAQRGTEKTGSRPARLGKVGDDEDPELGISRKEMFASAKKRRSGCVGKGREGYVVRISPYRAASVDGRELEAGQNSGDRTSAVDLPDADGLGLVPRSSKKKEKKR
ncbi:hypothetical protein FPV67DRAFT_1447704 [Lyophyllum atratum]|nr:hypothetical protein FPV67DRAFT_1447704 [Lyophyllum atratum]